jgi:hypothetical protein
VVEEGVTRATALRAGEVDFSNYVPLTAHRHGVYPGLWDRPPGHCQIRAARTGSTFVEFCAT